MGNDIKYDAFISYRHCDLDKFVAETLHEQLEAYRLPKKLRKSLSGRTKISRVFRDKDELPLTSNLEDPITKALSNSDFLIVICSPRLNESIWCRKEIETFIGMHGRNNVLAVLVEGEPDVSFPEELLYINEPVTNEDGTVTYVRKPTEPLAADFRGATKKEIKKAMKEEILRLLAPMFNVNYDDLKQRHRERRMKRIVSAAAVVSCLALVFGGYFALTAMKIKKQNIKINEQKETLSEQASMLEIQNKALRENQAVNLAKEAERLLKDDDRKGAITTAYEALTAKDGIEMPYTAQAQNILTSALSVYDAGLMVRAVNQIEVPGIVEDLLVSPDGKYLLSRDNLNNLILWSAESREQLTKIENGGEPGQENTQKIFFNYGFLDDDAFYYSLSDGQVVRVDTSSYENTCLDLPEDSSLIVNSVCSDDGSEIYVRTFNNIYIVDSSAMKVKSSIAVSDDSNKTALFVSDNKHELYYFDGENSTTLLGVNTLNRELIFSCEGIKGNVKKCLAVDNMLVVVSDDFSDNLNGEAYITAIDKGTGEIIWEREEVGFAIEDIYHSVSSGRDTLLINCSQTFCMLDTKTGELLYNISLESDALYCSITDAGDYLVIKDNGAFNCLSAQTDKVMSEFPMIECTKLSFLKKAVGSFVGVPENGNRIVFYRYLRNVSAAEYDGDVVKMETGDGINIEEVYEWAVNNKLPKASYATSYIELDDINKVFVYYKDNILEVYQKDTMELLHTYTTEGWSISYMGIINGYYIISDSNAGLLFNENGEMCAYIPYFVGLTSDKDKIVVYGRDDKSYKREYAMPVYSLDEIKEKTKDNMDK